MEVKALNTNAYSIGAALDALAVYTLVTVAENHGEPYSVRIFTHKMSRGKNQDIMSAREQLQPLQEAFTVSFCSFVGCF